MTDKLENKRDFSVFAELKYSSPNMKQVMEPSINETRKRVACYVDAGVSGISILTEPDYFNGSLDYLAEASKMFSSIPILMKDFVIDPSQIEAAKYHGASSILLIAKILSENEIDGLIDFAQRLNMEVVLEINNLQEMKYALTTETDIIGINNRNLDTFDLDIAVTEKLLARVSDWSKPFIALSGTTSPGEAYRMKKAGASGILVGTALSRAKDPATLIKKLKSV